MNKLDMTIIDCEASSRLTAPAYLAWQRIKEAAPPKQPTDAMIEAGFRALCEAETDDNNALMYSAVEAIWCAMWDAANRENDNG